MSDYSSILKPINSQKKALKPYIYFQNEGNSAGRKGKRIFYEFDLEKNKNQYVASFKAEVDAVSPSRHIFTFLFIVKVYTGTPIQDKFPRQGIIKVPREFDEYTVRDDDKVEIKVKLEDPNHPSGHTHDHSHVHEHSNDESEFDPITHDGTSTLHGGDADKDD